MNELKHFNEPAFEVEVLGSDKPVLVDFYADWCGPCRMMAPVIEQLAGEFDGQVVVGKLDVDSAQAVATRYQVLGIPTLGLFKDGRMVDRLVGYPGPGGVRAWLARGLEAVTA
ncbi:MAG: thioredoxin [Candidatus Dormibacterales bacterium]